MLAKIWFVACYIINTTFFKKETLKMTLKKFSYFSATYRINTLEIRNNHNVPHAFLNKIEGKTHRENTTCRQFIN